MFKNSAMGWLKVDMVCKCENWVNVCFIPSNNTLRFFFLFNANTEEVRRMCVFSNHARILKNICILLFPRLAQHSAYYQRSMHNISIYAALLMADNTSRKFW